VAKPPTTRRDRMEGITRTPDTPPLRGLFEWAVEAQLVKHNPTAGVKDPRRRKTEGFPVWSEEDVERYCQRWLLGTKERVWLDVLLYTGYGAVMP
jgi:site-specific recombinase XerD